MRISHSKKFAFMAIPQTGSTTVRFLLNKYSQVFSDESWTLRHHQPEPQLRSLLSSLGVGDADYFLFATVRNPYARLYSAHCYYLKVASEPRQQYSYAPNFWEFCNQYAEQSTTFSENLVRGALTQETQSSFFLEVGDSIVRPVRLERLGRELQPIWARLGLDLSDLETIPVHNRSAPQDYRLAYDDAARELVGHNFQQELLRFGYDFDGVMTD